MPPGFPFIVDASTCDPADLWGIDVGEPSCHLHHNAGKDEPEAPPRVLSAYDASMIAGAALRTATLLPLPPGVSFPTSPQGKLLMIPVQPGHEGLKLSTNMKTVLTYSTFQVTCKPTRWCRNFCYGNTGHFGNATVLFALRINAHIQETLFAQAPLRKLEQIADLIVAATASADLTNIRWHGVGDLTPANLRLLDVLSRRHPRFRVWGFTRRGELLRDFAPRPNVVFWCSIDPTMPASRLRAQREAAQLHRTGLSYSTHYGMQYAPSTRTPLRNHTALEPDRFLLQLFQERVRPAVIFGYHGAGRTTHVSVDWTDPAKPRPIYELDECPATDPLGGGHSFGTCIMCGWCMDKPEERAERSLLAHKHATTILSDDHREVRLLDGTPVE